MNLATLSKDTLIQALQHALAHNVTCADLARCLKPVDWARLPNVSWCSIIQYLDLRDVIFVHKTARFLRAHVLNVKERFLVISEREVFVGTMEWNKNGLVVHKRLLPAFLDRLVSTVEVDTLEDARPHWFDTDRITTRFRDMYDGAIHTEPQLHALKKNVSILGEFELINALTKNVLSPPKKEPVHPYHRPGGHDRFLDWLGTDSQRPLYYEPIITPYGPSAVGGSDPEQFSASRLRRGGARRNGRGARPPSHDTQSISASPPSEAKELTRSEQKRQRDGVPPDSVFQNVHEGFFGLNSIGSDRFATFCTDLFECYPSLTSIHITHSDGDHASRLEDFNHLPARVKKLNLDAIGLIPEEAYVATYAHLWHHHPFYELESFTVTVSDAQFRFMDTFMDKDKCKWKRLVLVLVRVSVVESDWHATFPPCLTHLELQLDGTRRTCIDLSECKTLTRLSVTLTEGLNTTRFEIPHVPETCEHVTIELAPALLLLDSVRDILAHVLSVAPGLASLVVDVRDVSAKDHARIFGIQREDVLRRVKKKTTKTFFDIRWKRF